MNFNRPHKGIKRILWQINKLRLSEGFTGCDATQEAVLIFISFANAIDTRRWRMHVLLLLLSLLLSLFFAQIPCKSMSHFCH